MFIAGRRKYLHMKIAVPTYNGEIFQHFGSCPEFTIFTVSDDGFLDVDIISNTGSGHGALLQVLYDNEVNALLCGGIGGGARNGLAQLGIRLFPGISGNALEAVTALLNGTLTYDPNASCGHHHHHEEGGDCHCGEHGHHHEHGDDCHCHH